ncbi:DUF2520 domain-containing protein [bacterium]|nr:DUF2520 domain-containing protein [bacterium]
MNIFLIGQGNVGTALSNFLKENGIGHEILEKVPENKSGILFLAVSDSAVKPLLEETSLKNPEIFAVHFSAATHFESSRVFLIHPFSSINKKSELNQIFFTLWGEKNTIFEEMLKKTELNFVYCGRNPDTLYHASAVMSGNFTQFFALQALKILQSSGFSKEISEKLIRQLVNSSLDNVFSDGIKGITGPAARGEKEILLNEINALSERDKKLSELFKAVNQVISESFEKAAKIDKT